ncbi:MULTISPECIES: MaoC/PaaZ C-terminal domain-containing protein [Xanthobacter]|uniref:MaoC/PaaZ C-terminal domain-containing protein n=1 Tax=Xanthobacter aminoxidans TaxID=186280 RepID=A0ABW6ZN22_9HYPH|nr:MULTISPECIES: MaoC/PaaZ C-terminal domain-containing protein [unclassified Xanthobacter]
MQDFHVKPGDSAVFTKTVGETDVYLFAGITGDFAPNHVNRPFMERSRFGRLQAHGALLVGFMSTVAGMIAARTPPEANEIAVALGYDRIRFVKPVFLGDTVTTHYRVSTVDAARRRASAEIEVTNQDGTLVAVASHTLAWVPNTPAAG